MKKKYLNLSPEIQEYIEFALSDGKLTSMEVDFIKRKALAYGDDLVEVEMVLSRILSELEKENQKEVPKFIEIKPKYGLVDSYFQALKKYSHFNGRASRSEFWYFILANFMMLFTLITVIGIKGEDFGNNENNLIFLGLFIFLYPLLMLTPFLSLCARRLHDVGLSGWLALIPMYNIYLFCKKGNNGDNKYGADPYHRIIKKISNHKNKYIDNITSSKVETIGATMFGIGATAHEAIEFKIIDFHQLDQLNKWLWILGGVLIFIPKSVKYLSKKTQSEGT